MSRRMMTMVTAAVAMTAAVAVSVAVFPMSAHAAPLVDETFGGGLTGWARSGGSWKVASGELVQSRAGVARARLFTGSAAWQDYTVSASVALGAGTSASGSAGVLARVAGSTKYLRLAVTGAGTARLDLVHGSRATLVGEVPVATPTAPHTLRLEVSGGTARGLVDGRPVGAGEVVGLPRSGRVGLVTSWATGRFDDVLVVSGPAPAATPSVTPSVTPSPTPTPTVTPAPTPTAAGGAAYKGIANASCGDLGKLGVSWWYNWYVTPGSCTVGEFVPMVSGKDKHGAGDIAWQRDQVVKGGYTTMLGFNEPDRSDQANMSVDLAISLWPTLTSEPGIRVGGPATSGSGRAWMEAFLQQADAKNLRVDFLPIHWYGWNAGSCDAKAANFEAYLRWAESLPGDRPIWVTEFGCLNKSNTDEAAVAAFYRAAVDVLARHPRVERHAWYPWTTNNRVVDAGGALTAVGRAVAAAPGTRG